MALADRIQKKTVDTSHPLTLICGKAGSAKTTFAASYPKPLFLDFDKRLASVAHLNPDFITFERASPGTRTDTYRDTLDVLRELKQGSNDYETVVLDSLSTWSSFLEASLTGGSTDKSMEIQQYNLYKMKLESMLTLLQGFPMQVVVTAHLDYLEDPDSKKVHAYPWVTGRKMGPRVSGWFDEVYLAHYDETKDKFFIDVKPSGKFHEARSNLIKNTKTLEEPTYTSLLKAANGRG